MWSLIGQGFCEGVGRYQCQGFNYECWFRCWMRWTSSRRSSCNCSSYRDCTCWKERKSCEEGRIRRIKLWHGLWFIWVIPKTVLQDTSIFVQFCCTLIKGKNKVIVILVGGIESRWRRDFLPVQTGPGAHTASCKMGTGSFPGVKCGRGVLLTTHPLLVPRSWKSRAMPLPTLWATPGL